MTKRVLDKPHGAIIHRPRTLADYTDAELDDIVTRATSNPHAHIPNAVRAEMERRRVLRKDQRALSMPGKKAIHVDKDGRPTMREKPAPAEPMLTQEQIAERERQIGHVEQVADLSHLARR
jgi:hypothetical protein